MRVKSHWYAQAMLETLQQSPYLKAAQEVLFESLWPTACIGCSTPGILLCARCKQQLPYLDLWRACPSCGSPLGHTQCCECNPVILSTFGLQELPYTTCRSAVLFEENGARIATYYKDRGERRMAPLMASLMSSYLPTMWPESKPAAITFIPATAAALRKRGFDHAHVLAKHLTALTGLPCLEIFERPASKDQRTLSRKERSSNMDNRFTLKEAVDLPSALLLIDDVYTTGATMLSASKALKDQGVFVVHCLTFARVP